MKNNDNAYLSVALASIILALVLMLAAKCALASPCVSHDEAVSTIKERNESDFKKVGIYADLQRASAVLFLTVWKDKHPDFNFRKGTDALLVFYKSIRTEHGWVDDPELWIVTFKSGCATGEGPMWRQIYDEILPKARGL